MTKVIEQTIQLLFVFEILCFVTIIRAATDLNCTIHPQSPNQACCAIPQLFEDKDLEKCADVKPSNTSTNFNASAGLSHQCSLNSAPNVTVLGKRCLQYKCLAETFDFITDNKFLQEPLIKHFIKRLRKNRNEQWIHSISDAVELCVEDVERNEFEIVETFSAAPFNITLDLCHPKHVALFQCIQIKTFINCPLAKFNSNAYCFDWKDYAIFCVKNFKNLPLIDLSNVL